MSTMLRNDFKWVDCKKKGKILLLLDLVYSKPGITLHFVHKSILVHDFDSQT